MTDFNTERNTIIYDGSLSILSVFPIGFSDTKEYLRRVKSLCLKDDAKEEKTSTGFWAKLFNRLFAKNDKTDKPEIDLGFITRIRNCAVGYTNKKTKVLNHCSCFDIFDSFFEENKYEIKSKRRITKVCKDSQEQKYSQSNQGQPLPKAYRKYEQVTRKRNLWMRLYLGTTFFYWCKKTIRLDIFIKLYLKKNVGILNFNFSLDNLSVQEAIAMRHMIESKSANKEHDWWVCCFTKSPSTQVCQLKSGAVYALYEELMARLVTDKRKRPIVLIEGKDSMKNFFISAYTELLEAFPLRTNKQKTGDPLVDEVVEHSPRFDMQTITELRSIGDFASSGGKKAHQWACDHAQMVYSIITGDEGIGYITEELAQKRIDNHWGSRDFVDTIAIKKDVLSLNAKTTSVIGKAYIKFQQKWNHQYDGGKNRMNYFADKPCIAGFDHGVLREVERNMVIGFFYDFIDHQEKTSSRKLQKQRQQLISFITASRSPIGEINEMFEIISRASGIDRSIEQIRNRLDIQSEGMNIDYQYKNNDIINILTVMSLTIAILAIQKGSLLLGIPKIQYKIIFLFITLVICLLISIGVPYLLSWLRKRHNR